MLDLKLRLTTVCFTIILLWKGFLNFVKMAHNENINFTRLNIYYLTTEHISYVQ